MTTGKGVAIGGGLIALAMLFSGGEDTADITSVPAIQPVVHTVPDTKKEPTQTPPLVAEEIKEAAVAENLNFESATEILIEPESTPTPYVPKIAPNPVSNGYTCNCSKTCTQMNSCSEAYYQLNSCGCSRRDGDNDGIPCESICN